MRSWRGRTEVGTLCSTVVVVLSAAFVITSAASSTSSRPVSAEAATELAVIETAAAASVSAVRGAQVRVVPPGCGTTQAFVIGDSLTVGAAAYGGLLGHLSRAGFDALVDAKVGRFTSAGAQILASREASGRLESLVLVALGTNDVYNTIDAARLDLIIDRAMAATGPHRTVVWVNLHLRSTVRATAFNTALLRAAERHGNLIVADWQADPASRTLASDGVHLTTAGYRERARFMVDALVRLPCLQP